jgi:hypothetical protein
MRLTFILGILYLTVLRARNPSQRPPAPGEQQASIVWGSVVSQPGEAS